MVYPQDQNKAKNSDPPSEIVELWSWNKWFHMSWLETMKIHEEYGNIFRVLTYLFEKNLPVWFSFRDVEEF